MPPSETELPAPPYALTPKAGTFDQIGISDNLVPFSWPNQRVMLALGTSMEARPHTCVSEGWGAWQKALLSVVFGKRLVPVRCVTSEMNPVVRQEQAISEGIALPNHPVCLSSIFSLVCRLVSLG